MERNKLAALARLAERKRQLQREQELEEMAHMSVISNGYDEPIARPSGSGQVTSAATLHPSESAPTIDLYQ